MFRTAPHRRKADAPATNGYSRPSASRWQASAAGTSRVDGRSVFVEATDKGRRALELGRERRVTERGRRLLDALSVEELDLLDRATEIVERVSRLPTSAPDTYAAATAERRWSGLADDSSGSGGASG